MSIEIKEFPNRKEWYLNNVLHRDNDLPAIEWNNGSKEWWKNGKEHRDGDLPAVVYSDGDKEWWKNGERHRDDDLPAFICNGIKEWWKNGKRHRDNDLPAVEFSNGSKYWYKHGLRHRDDDLPAVERPDVNNWFWFDKPVSREKALELSNQYNQAIQIIKNFRSKVKRYSAMCGLTPKKFQRVLSVLKNREFCEWWWHPDGFGGKNHLRNMEKMFRQSGWL
jgi:hypothetical protein